MITCSVCGANNKSKADTCHNCTSPLVRPGSTGSRRRPQTGQYQPTVIIPGLGGPAAEQPDGSANSEFDSTIPYDWTVNSANSQLKGAGKSAKKTVEGSPYMTIQTKQADHDAQGPTERVEPWPSPDAAPLVCSTCRTRNDASALFCRNCSASLREMVEVKPDKQGRISRTPNESSNQSSNQSTPRSVGDHARSNRANSPAPQPSELLCPRCGGRKRAAQDLCLNCCPPENTKTAVYHYAPPKPEGRLELVAENGELAEVFELEDEKVIGRVSGDIVFNLDGYMSSKHAMISHRDGQYVLKDLGSSNGTFIKIDREIALKPGDIIMIGRQLFRFMV